MRIELGPGKNLSIFRTRKNVLGTEVVQNDGKGVLVIVWNPRCIVKCAFVCLPSK